MTVDRVAVTAVTVTYGTRSSLCLATTAGALRAGVAHVVVVINGCPTETVDVLRGALRGEPRVTFIESADNQGSAAGFAAGISEALSEGAAYIWLLDDDNEPADDALGSLLAHARREPRAIHLSLRLERPLLRALADGRSVAATFPSRSSFLNFNLIDRLRRRAAHRVTAGRETIGDLPYAPFGGLLLPRAALASGLRPNAELFVYEDDTEFTHGLVAAGWQLVLVANSCVRDLDDPWYRCAEGRGPERLLLAPSDARVYYSVRNRVYFERWRWRGSAALYLANKLVVLTFLVGHAVRTRRFGRLRLILSAVRDGESRRLGRRHDLSVRA